MLVFRARPMGGAIAKSATEVVESGEWEFVKTSLGELSHEELEFAKGLDGEDLDAFLSLTKDSRSAFMKSDPTGSPGEEEEVAVAVEAPDGTVTEVAAVKPAGEAVTVSTPQISMSSAPAVVAEIGKAAGPAAGKPGMVDEEKKKPDEKEGDMTKGLHPVYKSADGRLFYNHESASIAKELDDLKEEAKKKEDEAKTEKAFNAYPHVPRSIVKHLVATGAGEAVFKDLLALEGQGGYMSKQFGVAVDEDTGANGFESLVMAKMKDGDVGYSKAVTEVLKTDAGREAYAAANPGQPH